MQPFVVINEIASLTAFEFETICRNYSSCVVLNDNTALCRILSKYKIYLDIRDNSLAPHLMLDGFWETWVTQHLATIIKPGDVCIDIGANFGYYSILMSALSGATGRTLAIEPNPHVCKLLKLTAGIHTNNFEIVQVALSNAKGKVTLSIPNDFFGRASIIDQSALQFLRRSKVKVPTISLDALVQEYNLEKVDVIKIDVEGVEPLVFEGMSQTIDKNPDLKIILEYSPFLYKDAKTFTEYLFSKFIVHRLKDVSETILLDESSIDELIQLNDHTDLYLQRR